MKQDAKDYSPITELSKAEADDLLEKAANGELILHAAISAHTAQLFATPFAKVARQGSRIRNLKQLVPITIQTANRLKFSHDATIESYLAIDPTLYPDTHPLADHLYFLDVPQTVTREQIYFRCDDEDAVVGNNPAPSAKVEAANPGWTDKARAIADELFNHDTKMNCRDSLKGYSKRVMELMQERNITGPRGIIDNANTVMRDALQGKKWWANKAK